MNALTDKLINSFLLNDLSQCSAPCFELAKLFYKKVFEYDLDLNKEDKWSDFEEVKNWENTVKQLTGDIACFSIPHPSGVEYFHCAVAIMPESLERKTAGELNEPFLLHTRPGHESGTVLQPTAQSGFMRHFKKAWRLKQWPKTSGK